MARLRNPSPSAATVRAYWAYMQKKYDSKVINKANSEEMKMAAWFLDKMGIQSKKTFMKKFTTTIGHNIYTPVKIGVGSASELRHQIALCAHEHKHVYQGNKNMFKFMWEYSTSPSKRIMYEVEAYRINLELHFYFTGEILDIEEMGDNMKNYGCPAKDIRVFKKYLKLYAKTVERGGVYDPIAKDAIKFLKAAQRPIRRRVVKRVR